MSEVKTVSVSGLGYIGLPTATMLAAHGIRVIGVDVNCYAVDTINQGRIHIVEPGLAEAVKQVVENGQLRATLTPEPADAFLIAVPTPFAEGHEPNLSFIENAVTALAPVLRPGNVVILESTSPVGTTESIAKWLKALRVDLHFAEETSEECDIYVAYCPERVLPGRVMRELVQNDRIIGGLNRVSAERACEIYKVFVRGELLITNSRTAEMAKLTENAFRDVNIAFANELSLICDRLGINVWDLITLANHHPRVNILQPGPGVGGHCIAIDPWFVVNKTPDLARLVRTAREVNDGKPEWVKAKVREAVAKCAEQGKSCDSVSIACLGLAFKPDIDDLRESPALRITQDLAREYPGQVSAVEPNIQDMPAELREVNCAGLVSLDKALAADVVVLLVDHAIFHARRPVMAPNQHLIDAKGVWCAS